MEPLPDLSTLTDDDLRITIRELEKENARLRMERDILKKATAYFAALEGGSRL